MVFLILNDELTKVNAELDRFMYSTSHDLRSPISSVLGLIQLTKMTNDPEEIKRYIEMIEGRLVSLNKFIKDISDYSRNACKNFLPRIFEMFFQAHEKSEGSGLGLYIVKEAICKLNGTIEATSKLEVGSQFM